MKGVWLRVTSRLRRIGRRTWLQIAAAALLAVALGSPRWPLPQSNWNHVIYLDITQSMNTRDMMVGGKPVSRLAFVQDALHDALLALPCGSRLGIGVFAEYRVLLLMTPVEVCANYDDVLAIIQRIDGRMSWAGASEISKGVFWSIRTTRLLEGTPTLMFITDGHEAPPLRPDYVPTFSERTDEVRGTILGVGGLALSPIPKFDPDGHPMGMWEADDVMQTDTISAGRTIGGSKQTLVEEDGKPVKVYQGSGTEHLSSLKEPHLREIADHTGLQYRRVVDSRDLVAALRDPRLARPAVAPRDLRFVPVTLALLLLAAVFVPWGRWRAGASGTVA